MAEDAPEFPNIAASLHAEDSFLNPRGFKIFTQNWLPPKVAATLVLVHGIGEHSDRYMPFVDHLLGQSIAVYTLDHESHGRSEGEKEYVQKVQHLVDDVIAVARTVHAANPGLPRLLFGHSMGGCISLAVCLQQPTLFQYAVFSAPTTSRPPSVNALLKAVGGVVAALGPKLRLTSLDKTTLSRNEARVAAYHADPLVWRQSIAAGFGYDILVVGDKLIDDAHLFTTPCLFLSGTADRIVSPEGSFKFFQKCSSADKTYISLDGWYHELLAEPDGHLLFPIITNWFADRVNLEDGAVRATNAHLFGGANIGEPLNLQPKQN